MTTPAQPSFQQQRRAARTAARTRQRAQLASRGARVTPEGAALYAGEKGAQAARSTARTVGQARIPTGDRAYQPVLLAEFLAAVVIVALLPIAAGGSDNAKAKGTPSPYDTGDLEQLVAIGGLYFILALASSGNSGRVSAWLGGLVLLGLAMKKLSGPLTEKLQAIKGGVAQFGKTAGGAV